MSLKEKRQLTARLLVLGGLVCALVGAALVEPAWARPCIASQRTFFAEPQHIHEVGYQYVDCSTGPHWYGQSTPYFDHEYLECCYTCYGFCAFDCAGGWGCT